MKRKWLLFLSSAVVAWPTIGITSCSNQKQDYDKLSQEIKSQAIDDFIGITHHPRPTGHTEEIRNYLTNCVTTLGYQVQKDNYGNIWFDIPATKGREDWKKLIIQGHMDMVVAGLTAEEQTIIPIEAEIVQTPDGEWVIQSKDHKTSLGADNGIGLGTMLAIIKNKHLQHGPLRFIITCDEETGMAGAAHLNPYALDSDYLINIDSETVNTCAKSSCGSVQGVYEEQVDEDAIIDIPENWNLYQMNIHGLKGGHSGIDIIGQANADRCLCEILNELNEKKIYPEEEDTGFVCLQDFGHPDPHDPTRQILWGPTQLITDAQVIFATSKQETNIDEAINTCVSRWKTKYPKENWDIGPDNVKIDCQPIPDTKGKTVIMKSTTSKILTLTGSDFSTFTTASGLPYGQISVTANALTDGTANIGPLEIHGRDFALKTYSRSTNDDVVDWFDMNNKDQWESRFTISGFSTPTKYYGWKGTENNQMIKLIQQSSDYFDQGCEEIDMAGGLEISWFVHKRPTIQVSSIGPTINMPHNVNETLHLNTLDITIKRLLYIIDHINETI